MHVNATIGSLDDFHAVLRQLWTQRSLFRGEPAEGYALRPKVGRLTEKAVRNGRGVERQMLSEFKRRGCAHIGSVPYNDWEWLALAQHFGLATRLLDWTQSPLTATYFATINPWSHTNRVLYAVDRLALPLADETKSPFDITEVMLYRPKHIDSRITAQAGEFTVHPDPAKEYDSPTLHRYVIHAKLVSELSLLLKNYGVNAATIFPDLNGLSAAINREWGIDLALHVASQST